MGTAVVQSRNRIRSWVASAAAALLVTGGAVWGGAQAANAVGITEDPPPAAVGVPFSYQFVVDDPVAEPFFWTLIDGDGNPDATIAGLTLDLNTGVLSGTPTQTGHFPYSVLAVRNAPNQAAYQHDGVIVVTDAVSLTGTPPTGLVGSAYSFAFAAGPADGNPSIAVTAGALPPGLSIAGLSVVGTPSGPGGAYPFTLTATGAGGTTASLATSITVNRPAAVTANPANTTVTAGQSASFTAAASGYPAPTVQWQRSNDAGGTWADVAGATSTTYAFTTAATDDGARFRAVFTNSTGSATTTSAVLTVQTVPTIVGTPAAGLVGSSYSYSYTVTGSPAPTVSVQSGALPPGLTLSTAGVLSGTPTTAGTYSFMVQATNAAGSATATSTVTIAPANTPNKANLSLTLTAPASTTLGQQYAYSVKTSNAGPAQAKQVYTTVLLPAGTTFVSATGSYVRYGQLVVWATPTLNNGASVTTSVTVKSASKGNKTAIGLAISTQTPDPSPFNNLALVTTKVN